MAIYINPDAIKLNSLNGSKLVDHSVGEQKLTVDLSSYISSLKTLVGAADIDGSVANQISVAVANLTGNPETDTKDSATIEGAKKYAYSLVADLKPVSLNSSYTIETSLEDDGSYTLRLNLSKTYTGNVIIEEKEDGVAAHVVWTTF